jgi:hypothetical protein
VDCLDVFARVGLFLEPPSADPPPPSAWRSAAAFFFTMLDQRTKLCAAPQGGFSFYRGLR